MVPAKQKTAPSVSYAQMAQKVQFPTKDQAIILDTVEGITIHEYTLVTARLTDPSNIRFASLISQGQVCLYLSSKEIANKLAESHTKVSIGT